MISNINQISLCQKKTFKTSNFFDFISFQNLINILNMELNIQLICRLCLSEEGVMSNIFENQRNIFNSSLANCILYLFGTKIEVKFFIFFKPNILILIISFFHSSYQSMIIYLN